MIDKFLIQDFKAHRNTHVPLGRFTMLVGDNASGKTSVLDALWLQSALNPNPVDVLRGDWLPDDLLRRGATGPVELTSWGRQGSGQWKTSVKLSMSPKSADDQPRHWELKLDGSMSQAIVSAEASGQGGGGSRGQGWDDLGTTVGKARLYRLRSDVIAAAAYSDRTEAFVEKDGANTAVVLANMKLSNDEAFDRVEEATRRIVRSVKRIRIRRAPVTGPNGMPVVGSKLYFDFVGAKDVPAHNASHGTLLVLALLTILHGANRPDLVLLDDFDHALHPRAQMELVRMLKELLALDEFEDLQIVATTHSPYTLDEMDPADVQAFALNEDGTVASKRLSEHPEAARMRGSLRAGQLWSLDPEREWVLRDQAA